MLGMFRRAFKVVAVFTLGIWLLTYTASGNIEDSALYAIGIAIEPVTRIFGMGWKHLPPGSVHWPSKSRLWEYFCVVCRWIDSTRLL